MQFDLASTLRLFGDSLRDPADVARRIKALRVPHEAGWIVLGFGTIAVVILLHLERMMPGGAAQVAGLGGTAIMDVIILGALSVMMVFVFYLIGRSMGGTGSFGSTLAMMAWFQIIVLILVVIQVTAAIVLPTVAGFIAIGSFVVQIYCLIHFVNVLHGFDSLPKSAGLLVASIIGLGFGLALIVLLIGGAAIAGGI
jgi:hypothetical protein